MAKFEIDSEHPALKDSVVTAEYLLVLGNGTAVFKDKDGRVLLAVGEGQYARITRVDPSVE